MPPPATIIALLIWISLVVVVGWALRRYARATSGKRTFWQFTIWQFLLLVAVCSLLIWIVHAWWVDYFEPTDRFAR